MSKGYPRIAFVLLAALVGCANESSSPNLAHEGRKQAALTQSEASVLGFEDSSQWAALIGQATLEQSSLNVEGQHSLAVSGFGYVQLRHGTPLAKNGTAPPSVVGYDIRLPEQQLNPWWLGDTQLYIDCPSAGIWNQHLGHHSLQGMATAQFQRVEFQVPEWIRNALGATDYQDLRFIIVINVTPNNGTYHLDRFTLGPLEQCVPQTCAAAGASCGTVDDSCGGTLNCGSCTAPDTCGGGDSPNECGCAVTVSCELESRDCGELPDGCGGQLDCGACGEGEVCDSLGHCSCVPMTCAALGIECGIAQDGCGGTLDCGGCQASQTCGGGGTPNVCGCAVTTTCASAGVQCGTITNNCGGTLDCGGCSDPETCGGGGTPNTCGCTITTTCASAGAECGAVTDNCGGTLNCGSCSDPETCGGSGIANQCGCTATTTCAGTNAECGTVTDNCGGTLNCGGCSAPETCGGGGTANACGCTVTATCAAVGAECGTISDGCGGSLNCGSCSGPETCGGSGNANQCGCAVATTCANAAAECGTITDNCGGTLDCGGCSDPETCGGDNTANQCGCAVAVSCELESRDCGLLADGCGGQIDCGACGTSQICDPLGKCVCEPTTCASAGAECGEIPNDCGGVLNCGSCVSPELCGGAGVANQCDCAGTTCGLEGVACGQIQDGCGGQLDCGVCDEDEVCDATGACVCVPKTCETLGVECGTISDGCGGTLDCGGCSAPEACGGGGTANTCGCTVSTSCAAAGADCGTLDDGCDGILNCGDCSTPETCGGNGTPNQCGCAVVTTCTNAGAECGPIADNCGGTLNCGDCSSPETCGGNGAANQCGCTVTTTCASAGASCGSITDNCGGALDCGGCSGSETCGGGGTPNQCGCTITTTCAEAGAECGTVADNCGGVLSCGTCVSPDTCGANGLANQCGCAVTTTCENAGAECGTVADNCGSTLSCGSCSAPETCGGSGTANQCGCTPSVTCVSAGAECGSITDNCGATLNCGTCAAPETCGANGTPNECGCSVVTTCANAGVECGTITDNCGGTLECGGCSSPNTCGGNGIANQCGCTVETTCASASASCGTITDNCGGTLDCGGCSDPETCGGGGTTNQCGCTVAVSCELESRDCGPLADGCGEQLDCGACANAETCDPLGQCICVPTSCALAGAECGTIDDGCGGVLNCGGCVAPESCGGGGVANQCDCSGTTCGLEGVACGQIQDGCGGQLDCGACDEDEACDATGQCVCVPKTCATLAIECGTISDGCGGTLDCGGCSAPETCGGTGTANQCGCTVATTCANAGAECGTITDNCGGTLSCGTCASPNSCGASGTPNQCGCEVTTTCTGAGAECGGIADNCGGTLDCGGCSAPETCGGGGTANACGCTVTATCAAVGAECGVIEDGCGGSLNCGTCSGFETCGGSGTANQCGCTVATTCANAGAECGTITDNCGGALDCGGCSSPETCGGSGSANQCGCAVVTTCANAGAECGTIVDNCGGTLSCGGCSSPETCGGSGSANQCGCTVVATCANAGAECGSIADNCGGTLNCGGCSSPQTCGGAGASNQCGCTPLSCAAAGAECGTATDGCGGTLECGTCNAGLVCGGAGVVTLCGHAPVANAGPDQEAELEALVSLDGSGSFDGDYQPLTFAWAITSRPTGSSAQLDNPVSQTPTFVADAVGTFVIELIVSDGNSQSSADAVNVVVAPPFVEVPNVVGLLQSAAQTAILDAGLTLGTVTAGYSTSLPVGAVLSQSPAGALQVAAGTPVALVVVVNRPPTLVATGDISTDPNGCVSFYVHASDLDGNAVTLDLQNAPSGMTLNSETGLVVWFPTASDIGTSTVTVVATDEHQASASDEFVVSVVALPDQTAPRVKVYAAKRVAPNTAFSTYLEATDDVGVVSVRFIVDDLLIEEKTTQPFNFLYSAGEDTANLSIKVVAADAANNVRESLVTVAIDDGTDTLAPAIESVSLAPKAAPGEVVSAAVSATDDWQITRVEYRSAAALLATAASPPFEASFAIPSDAAVGSTFTVTITAVDSAQHSTQTTRSIEIVSEPDSSGPSLVTLSTQGSVIRGRSFAVNTSAADDVGIFKVGVTSNGALVEHDFTAPFTPVDALSALNAHQSTFRLQATAYDFSGNSLSSAPQCVQIVAPQTGGVFGYVVNDALGRPVSASVEVLEAAGVALTPPTLLTTDARGRYEALLPEGRAKLSVAPTNFTRCTRVVDVVAERLVRPSDCRVTPLGAGVLVENVIGKDITFDHGIVLEVPPGAFAANTTLRLAATGEQSLAGPLPLGWRVGAGLVVAPEELATQLPLEIAVPASLYPSGSVAAAWDIGSATWKRVPASGPNDGSFRISMDKTGAVIWLQADTAPLAPAIPQVGEVLLGVAAGSFGPATTATLIPSPATILLRQDAVSRVMLRLNNGTLVSSGTPLEIDFTDSYTLLTGGSLDEAAPGQSVAIYARPSGREAVFSTSALPSAVTSAIVAGGTIQVVARPRNQQQFEPGTAIIGADGGALAIDGLQLSVPPGAVPGPTTIRVASLTSYSELDGFEVIGAVELEFGNTALTTGASLQFEPSVSVAPTDSVLLVYATTLEGETYYELVSVGIFAGNSVDAQPGALGLAFPGAKASGRYFFIRTPEAIGFITGQVLAAATDPSANALVGSDSLPFISLPRMGPDYAYAVAAFTGDATVSARDLATGKGASGHADVAEPGATAFLNLTLSELRPKVTSVSPSGASISRAANIRIVFSHALNGATVSAASVRLTNQDSGVDVPGSVSLIGGGLIAVFKPSAPLEDDTPYVLRVAASVADAFGATLDGNQPDGSYEELLRTEDTTPPRVAEDGTISLTVPDFGTTQVSGGPGTVPPGTLVVIVNDTTGQTTTVVAQADGSFSLSVDAELGDNITVLFIDDAGNETTYDPGAFRDADGRTVINSDGGEVVAADGFGITVFVPAGAVPDGTIMRVSGAEQATFEATSPSQLDFVRGVKLEMGNVVASQELDVVLDGPFAAGVTQTAQIFVLQQVAVDEAHKFSLVEEAHYLEGKISTASPPFPGVRSSGLYMFGLANTPLEVGVADVSSGYGEAGNVNVSFAGGDLAQSWKSGTPVVFFAPAGASSTFTVFGAGGVAYPSHVMGSLSGSSEVFIPAIDPDPATSFALSNGYPREGMQGVPIDGVFSLRFNKPLDSSRGFKTCATPAQSACVCLRRDAGSVCVPGEIEVPIDEGGQTRELKFTPSHRLGYDRKYAMGAPGLRNIYGAQTPATETKFTSFRPEVVKTMPGLPATPRAIAAIDANTVAVALGAPDEGQGFGDHGVALVDISNPQSPTFLGQTEQPMAGYAADLIKVPNTNYLLALNSGFHVESNVAALSVGGPQLLDFIHGKVLAYSVAVHENNEYDPNWPVGVPRPSYPVGLPRTLSLMPTGDGDWHVYVATIGIGIQRVLLSDVINDTGKRLPDSFSCINCTSVAVVNNQLLAADGNSLMVIANDLSGVSQRINIPATNITIEKAMAFDANRDGQRETLDLAFVTGHAAVGAQLTVASVGGAQVKVLQAVALPTVLGMGKALVDRVSNLIYAATADGTKVFDTLRIEAGVANSDGDGDTEPDGLIGLLAGTQNSVALAQTKDPTIGIAGTKSGLMVVRLAPNMDVLTVADALEPANGKTDFHSSPSVPADNSLVVISGTAQDERITIDYQLGAGSLSDLTVLWRLEVRGKPNVAPLGWSEVSGTFSGTPLELYWIRPAHPDFERHYSLHAGSDADGDGVLDPDEVSRTLHIALLRIKEVIWEGVVRNDGQTNLDIGGHPDEYGGGDRIFPGRNNPSGSEGDDLHDRVLARVNLDAPVPDGTSVTLQFKLFDVDHYSSSGGFDQNDVGAVPSPNDNVVAARDTLFSVGASLYQDDFAVPASSVELRGDGRKKTVDIGLAIEAMQPGNNWKVSAFAREAELGTVILGENAMTVHVGESEWEGTTPSLTVWRKLFAELDWMTTPDFDRGAGRSRWARNDGPPSANLNIGTASVAGFNAVRVDTRVLDPLDTLNLGSEEQFADGSVTLHDAQGVSLGKWNIISSSCDPAVLVYYLLELDAPVPANVAGYSNLVDDDLEGLTNPAHQVIDSEEKLKVRPDRWEFYLRPALVKPIFDHPMAASVGTAVSFEHHVPAARDLDGGNPSAGFIARRYLELHRAWTSETSFWVVHQLGAFQEAFDTDRDPRGPNDTLGVNWASTTQIEKQAGSLVFAETEREYCEAAGINCLEALEATSVHEMLHSFGFRDPIKDDNGEYQESPHGSIMDYRHSPLGVDGFAISDDGLALIQKCLSPGVWPWQDY